MGKISFVSIGPGSPEDITLKGYNTLKESSVIFAPKNSSGSSRAATILKGLGIDESLLELYELPMSINRTAAIEAYESLVMPIMERYQRGEKISIVAEGDGGLYSSVHYLYEKLSNQGAVCSKICGIPAFIAAGAVAGLHIASGEERLTIIPGATTSKEIESRLDNCERVIIMKLSRLERDSIDMLSKRENIALHYFENIGTQQELYISDKSAILNREFPYFSLLMIFPI